MTIPLPRRLPRFAAIAAMAVVLPLAGAATSQAGYADFDCSLPSGSLCSNNRHALRAVQAYTPTGRMVGTGASTTISASDAVGGFVWGNTYICAPFDGSRMLLPMVANGSTVSLVIQGTAEFGSGGIGC